jgi:hypothetical protein
MDKDHSIKKEEEEEMFYYPTGDKNDRGYYIQRKTIYKTPDDDDDHGIYCTLCNLDMQEDEEYYVLRLDYEDLTKSYIVRYVHNECYDTFKKVMNEKYRTGSGERGEYKKKKRKVEDVFFRLNNFKVYHSQSNDFLFVLALIGLLAVILVSCSCTFIMNR